MYEIRFEPDCDASTFHFHDEMEILYVLSGRLGVMANGKNYVLGIEEFVVFNPFDYHEIYKEVGCHTLSAFISLHLLQQCEMGEINCCSVLQLEKPEYLSLVRSKLAAIYNHYLGQQPERSLLIQSELYDLLAILKQQFEEKQNLPKEERPLLYDNKMKQILLYIHDHFTEDISLQDVADNTYVSSGYLSRQFLKLIGVHFSEYLRMLRLNKAIHLLRSSELPVIDIAEECGFQNVNTFIANFKKEYGNTPSSYRKNMTATRDEQWEIQADRTNNARLLRHASDEQIHRPLNRKYYKTDEIRTNINCGKNPPRLQLQKAVSLGFNSDFFDERYRGVLMKGVHDLKLQYVCVQGIFCDSMNIYHENLDGTPWFDFTYLDIILDFICSTGAKPWIELSFTPEKMLDEKKMIFNRSYIQLPSYMDKWENLLDYSMEHFIKRYTYRQVREWRFSVFPPLYISYGLFSLEEYLEYYCRTWKRVRQKLPDVLLAGGTFDIGYLRIDGDSLLVRFLQYCQEHQCLPDEICLQSFTVDYTCLPREEIEKRILFNIRKDEAEPAPPNSDRDLLYHNLEFIHTVLDDNGLKDLPVSIIYWGSMWRSDLGNDTCYKAAYIVKNYLENAGNYSVLNYLCLMDSVYGLDNMPLVFNGDWGLVTYTGIPKAAYYAFGLMAQLESIILSQGDGYMITCSDDRDRISILLYHYCHYNLDVHLDKVIPREEQLTVNRYYSFEDLGIRKFQIYLNKLKEGTYNKETSIIDKENGSSYDTWRKIGAPEMLSEKQNKYLKSASIPGYKYELLRVKEGEEVLITAALNEHEVCLVCLTRDK